MKLSRRHGVVRLRLDEMESALLASVLDELLDRLRDESVPADDPVQRRLFPAAYAEADAAAEFHGLTAAGLREDRIERASACRHQVASGAGEIDVDGESGDVWIRVLNDLRLVLGTNLQVTESDDHDVDPDDPDAGPRTVYYWLSYLQESIVRALMR